jgi:hypothetical protein
LILGKFGVEAFGPDVEAHGVADFGPFEGFADQA